MAVRFRLLAVAMSAAAIAAAGYAQDAPGEGRAAPVPNIALGATLFKQRCQMCHAVNPGQANPLGPNLAGVAGRKVGTGKFNYSAAFKKSELTWDAANLDRYLAAPAGLMPGTSMVIAVPNPKERADLVAYLAGLK